MKQALAITRKELDNYFGSPMALIFVGIFLVIVLFSFFWVSGVSGFFARGIADVRPLFQWMPLLLIFLISTLTMRQWSEEQQTGTLELLLTMPIKLTQLVIGKFLAVLGLVCVALLLTISLPVTVALLGRLDFGPVIGGYLAAVLMAAAYSAIGLFISSRTANQIVALLLTAIVCGLFYLVGTQTITSLTTSNIAEFLRALGTGSRFESIERGVIDLRDLLYYVTITAIFLALNVLSIESKRWSIGARTANYRFNRRLTSALIVINLIVFNSLFARVNVARADLTQGGDYTLSPVTQELLGSLQEPLLIRGYFSQETHPLLAPLIPYIRDMLQEYSVAAKGKLGVEFVDPLTNPALEQEANQTYGIRPTPLQVNGRGKSSVVNAYLNILIRYGDQNVVLNLLDMIEVQQMGGTPDVHLRNLEYDLTSSIQRVVYGFQNIDAVLASLKQPAQLTLYVTPKTLPDQLKDAPTLITTVANTISKEANGKLIFKTVDMSDPKSGVNAQSLMDQYQIQPIAAGLFSQDTFYLHMVADADGKTQVIFPPTDVSETQIRNDIESAFKRAAPGFLHSVGFWAPQGGQQNNPFGQQQAIQQYNTVQQALSKNFDVRTVDLTSGQVPADLSALVLIGPQNMTDIERYAVDQYLMRGGAVFAAAGNFQMSVGQDGNLGIQPITDGLQAMLAGYGVTVDQSLVLDTQNAPFPVPVQRNVGNVTVNEVQALNYPHFVDVRSDGMDQQSQIIAGLPDITLNWVSPITIDQNKLKDAKITTLLKSTASSWLTKNTNAQPDLTLYPDTGFPVEGDRSARTLAVLVQGSFTSYFAGKPSPFSAQNMTPTPGPTPAATPTTAVAAASFVQKSPDTARLIVVGSSEFLDDTVFNLERRLGGDPSVTSVQLVQNSVDWFSEDVALASIRAKGTNTRLLAPLSDPEKSRWEIANYVFALVCLIALGVIWQLRKRSEKPMKLILPAKKSDHQRLTAAPAHEGEA